jgi:hypothetical protein
VAASGGNLSVRSVYRGAVATVRGKWPLLLVTAVVVFVPVGLLDALDTRIQELDKDAFTDLQAVALVGITVVHAGTALIGEVFYAGVVAAATVQTRTGASRSVGQLVRTLRYGRLVAVDLLFSLVVVAGLGVLVVPGLVFFTWFALAAPVVELEGRGVAGAFRRSRELVRGSFWPVFAILVPLELSTDALTDAAGALATAALGDTLLADWTGSALAELLLTPLFAVAVVAVAYELIELEDTAARDETKVRIPAGREEPA